MRTGPKPPVSLIFFPVSFLLFLLFTSSSFLFLQGSPFLYIYFSFIHPEISDFSAFSGIILRIYSSHILSSSSPSFNIASVSSSQISEGLYSSSIWIRCFSLSSAGTYPCSAYISSSFSLLTESSSVFGWRFKM